MYIELKRGGYGYGLFLHGSGDRYVGNGSLHGPSAFGHIGYASSACWADPEYDLIGVMLYVSPRLVRDIPYAPTDLFQNAVYGALAE
jgi:CubicO group peptidase (beta-lactamase class C family)